MRKAGASLSGKLILLFICALVSACNGSYTAFEDDKDFDRDPKTVDIETDNSESLSLSILQSAYLAHYQSALYDFLDASDLPEDVTFVPERNVYERSCAVEGTVNYSFTRAAGVTHKSDDRITVIYDNCDEGDIKYDGKLTARYTKVKGLNNSFVGTDTPTCTENLQQQLDISDRNVIHVSGDDIKFRRVADTLEVDVLDYQFTQEGEQTIRTDVVLETHVVGKKERVIIVNTLLSPPVNAVTSINGDQLYSVIDNTDKKYACQSFERTLKASLNNFSTQKNDLKTTLNGSVTLYEAQENANRVNQEIINSDFKTIVQQGNITETYSMTDYRVQKTLDRAKRSYAYLFEGFVSSSVLGGKVQLTKSGKLLGNLDESYPFSGSLEFLGRGLERINLLVTNQTIRIQIDFNGDSTGTGFGDIDVFIDTNWTDLFERNFQF